jgi:hypothetical protein
VIGRCTLISTSWVHILARLEPIQGTRAFKGAPSTTIARRTCALMRGRPPVLVEEPVSRVIDINRADRAGRT